MAEFTHRRSAAAVRDLPSDEALVDRVGRGEDGALAELYETCGKIAFAVALRITRDAGLAEDAVQDAFVGAWRNAGGYAASRASAKTWLLSIVHHRAVDIARRRGRNRESPMAEIQPAEAPLAGRSVAFDLSRVVQHRLDAAELRVALGLLPGPQREAIELAYFAGYSQVEIAAATGTPLGTVKSRVRGGLKALRRELDDGRMGPGRVRSRRARRRAMAA